MIFVSWFSPCRLLLTYAQLSGVHGSLSIVNWLRALAGAATDVKHVEKKSSSKETLNAI